MYSERLAKSMLIVCVTQVVVVGAGPQGCCASVAEQLRIMGIRDVVVL